MFKYLYTLYTDNPQVFIATVAAIVAFGSAIFNIYSFRYKNKKENLDADKKLTIDYLKSLILDYNLEHFYAFFDNVEEEMKKLRISAPSEDLKKSVIEKIEDHRIFLNRKFIDLLLAVDETLYNETMEKVDCLVDDFIETIADKGVNLEHQPKFREVVLDKITLTRTNIIKGFFKFKGESLKPSLLTVGRRKLVKLLDKQ